MKVMFVTVHSLHLHFSYTIQHINSYSSISLSSIIRKSRNHLSNIHWCLSTSSIIYLEDLVTYITFLIIHHTELAMIAPDDQCYYYYSWIVSQSRSLLHCYYNINKNFNWYLKTFLIKLKLYIVLPTM